MLTLVSRPPLSPQLTIIIPACGVWGAIKQSRGFTKAFVIANAVCAAVYIAGIIFLAGVVIPSLRCMCDTSCLASITTDPFAAAHQLAQEPHQQQQQQQPQPQQQHFYFSGEDENEAAIFTDVTADISLAESAVAQSSVCAGSAFVKLYFDALLSLAAAAIHVCWCCPCLCFACLL